MDDIVNSRRTTASKEAITNKAVQLDEVSNPRSCMIRASSLLVGDSSGVEAVSLLLHPHGDLANESISNARRLPLQFISLYLDARVLSAPLEVHGSVSRPPEHLANVCPDHVDLLFCARLQDYQAKDENE